MTSSYQENLRYLVGEGRHPESFFLVVFGLTNLRRGVLVVLTLEGRDEGEQQKTTNSPASNFYSTEISAESKIYIDYLDVDCNIPV